MTLSDQDIEDAMARGELIKGGDPSCLSGACYELRFGNVYYDLTESEQPINVHGEGTALLKPGHRVVLITHEQLNIPSDILARVVNKGSLFSVGLSPVATYADPGFQGHIGIVTQNISDRYIELPFLEPIAKVDFTRLSSKTSHPYKGAHGFNTKIWPIKNSLRKTYAEIAGDPRVGSEKDEAYKLLPRATATVLREIETRQKITNIAILFGVLINSGALYLYGSNLIDGFLGLVGNLVASAVVALVVLIANLTAKISQG